MTILQSVRGTHDLFSDGLNQHISIINEARRIASLAGFQEISTPIIEFKDVFHRTLGNSSDIITKEMYEIKDRGNESIVLRPEGTAGIVRAVLSNGLIQSLPLKLFYHGPMFRYERPQKGRTRQFHQIGVELLGVANPMGDIEVVLMAYNILKALGCLDKVVLEINTLGDDESRSHYRQALVNFLESKRKHLSEESQIRLEKNPLRILDSKDQGDKDLLKEAPLLKDFLNADSELYFQEICQGLKELNINCEINPFIVRGLDYYCHLAFEFTSAVLGAQSAAIAGGRYDGLVSMMGGPAVAGVGWGGGIERLAMLMAYEPSEIRPVGIIPFDNSFSSIAFSIADKLRQQGITVDMTYSGNLAKRLKKVAKANAQFAILLGEEESKTQFATVKDLNAGIQHQVSFEQLANFFKEKGVK